MPNYLPNCLPWASNNQEDEIQPQATNGIHATREPDSDTESKMSDVLDFPFPYRLAFHKNRN
ncbi:uncharacterized protein N7483_012888 [Penicillium malachiteum]|uniref:uncharacterized protein n=1 Tax=Penicillium malachiteum TaxID=1324776 RepID=UPI002546F788|nr:uncharacterized protein N7483_012888 [Penicillium malachiteum]KAJ5715707.1 hypothetical protein N7483_012888 [Penicillium malachiteum]